LNLSSRVYLTLVLLLGFSVDLHAAKLFDSVAKKKLTGYLDEICQWIMTTEFTGDTLKILPEGQDSLAVRGNFARVLVAGFELSKNNSKYLDEALRWGDAFASAQMRVVTSRGNEGGYWQERGAKGMLDLADLSVAASALARIHVYAEGHRKQDYLQALERYARFVVEGCKEDPLGKGRGGSHGWVVYEGNDRGAIANGYDETRVLVKPSTAATATHAALLARIYWLNKNRQCRDLAADAIRWILKTRKPIGEIPDYRDGQESEERPLQTLTSCAESFLAAAHLLEDTSLNQQITKDVEPTVRWLIRIQNDEGVWADGLDRQRSSGAALLLAWFYLNTKADETIPQHLEKFWQVLLNPVHSQSFGVQMLGLTTGQVGLVTAEMIKPGITFKKI
jgi:hypothetical protein